MIGEKVRGYIMPDFKCDYCDRQLKEDAIKCDCGAYKTELGWIFVSPSAQDKSKTQILKNTRQIRKDLHEGH